MLLDAAEQDFIIIVLFSFILIFSSLCREVFLFSSPKLRKGSKGERKEKVKTKSPKNNTRA